MSLLIINQSIDLNYYSKLPTVGMTETSEEKNKNNNKKKMKSLFPRKN